jgi:hypothetical protein
VKLKALSNLFSFSLLLGSLALVAPSTTNAATTGTAPCAQTIDITAGVSVFRDGSSCYVAFKTAQSYIWTPPSGVNSIDLLVIAGGGGGGSRHAGGGGAGGLINNLNVALTSNNLSITVGAGGAGGAAASSGGNNGSNGFDSVVSGTGLTTRTAVGGGGGGYGGATNSGGSGAGGGSSGAGGSATPGQGNAGSAGLTNSSSFWVGGGGGGAGSGGGASASNKGGNGGAGIEIAWITASASSNTGVGVLSSTKYYLAGGGGGGTDSNSIPGGSAGVGGGGIGATGTGDATNGSANTGGGGGGSGISGVGTGSKKGGDGGSGVVVIRYIIPSAQFTAGNYTAGSTTWANDISGGTAGTAQSGGMQKTSSGPSGVIFAGKESSNSDRLISSIGSTTSVDSVTVEMWIRLKDSGSTQNVSGSMLFSWNTSTSNYNIYHFQDGLGFNTFQSQLFGIDSSSYNNAWTHFVFVMTDTGSWSSQKIYVNGVSQSLTCRFGTACTNSDARSFSSTGNFMLMDHPNATNTWNARGDLGLVRVYDRELTAAAVQNIYSATNADYYEAPDTTAPTFTNSTTFSLAENSAITDNAATILVNESATVTINSGNDSALFNVVTSDSTTARIRFLSSPNFEAPTDVGANNVYDISVRATDTAGNFANQSVSITIADINEAPRITNFSSNPTAALSQAENVSSVATYAATDPDAGAVLRFTITGTDAADFSIDSVTGVVTFGINPDFEAPLDSDTNNAYVVIITVSDGLLTDTQTLTVSITNANESSSVGTPSFSAATIKGVSVTISITSNVSGRARFFVNGKRIPACLSRSASGSYPNFTTTCSWKPPVTGRQNVSAIFTPTDASFSAANSPVATIQVLKRATTR